MLPCALPTPSLRRARWDTEEALGRKHVLQAFFALFSSALLKKAIGKSNSRANIPPLDIIRGVSNNKEIPLKRYQGMVFPFWQR